MPVEPAMPTARAIRELVALVLIWAGTAGITFFGIPELSPSRPIRIGSTFIRMPDGHILGTPLNPKELEAREAYFRWAGGGMTLISGGMLLQGITPALAIVQNRRQRRQQMAQP